MTPTTSTVTAKGQTTLPKAVRDALHVAPGQRIVYEIEGDVVRIRSAHAAIDALLGAFARPDLGAQDLDAAREAFAEEMARRAVQAVP